MKKWCFAVVLAGLFATGLLADEPTPDELLKQLQAAVEKAVADLPADSSLKNPVIWNETFSSLRQSLKRGNFGMLQQFLEYIRTQVPGDDVKKIADTLESQVQQGLAAKDKAYIDVVDAAVNQAVKLALAAKTIEELDASITELNVLAQPAVSERSEAVNRASGKAQAAVTFLCRWQDYLLQVKLGNIGAVQGILNELALAGTKYPFVPRSEILARQPGRGKASEAGTDTVTGGPSLEGKKLADLASLNAQARELAFRDRESPQLQEFRSDLKDIDRAYQLLKAGVIGQALHVGLGYDGGRDKWAMLPSEARASGGETRVFADTVKSYPVQPKETPVAYTLRVVKEARAKGDWLTVSKALGGYKMVTFADGRTPAWLGSDIQAIDYYVSAQNFEKAGEYTGAIKLYNSVLMKPGQYGPAGEAVARLEVLKKERPAEYQAATQPPASRTETRPVP